MNPPPGYIHAVRMYCSLVNANTGGKSALPILLVMIQLMLIIHTYYYTYYDTTNTYYIYTKYDTTYTIIRISILNSYSLFLSLHYTIYTYYYTNRTYYYTDYT